jgi:transposase InsO family protein
MENTRFFKFAESLNPLKACCCQSPLSPAIRQRSPGLVRVRTVSTVTNPCVCNSLSRARTFRDVAMVLMLSARTSRMENGSRGHFAVSVSEARASIGRYLNLYNHRRPHSSLDGMTPDQAYSRST